MRFRLALMGIAALALLVPSVAFGHGGHRSNRVDKFIKHELKDQVGDRIKDARDRRFERRFDRNFRGWWWRHHRHDQHQQFSLGAEALHLTGWGLLGSRSVKHPAAVEGQDPPATTLRAYRGVLKVYAKTDDVQVTCTGSGYRSTRTNKNGHTITKCKGVGVATITGSEFAFVLRAKAMQGWFPAGSEGTIHNWGFAWAGDLIPVDGDGVLSETAAPTDGVGEKTGAKEAL